MVAGGALAFLLIPNRIEKPRTTSPSFCDPCSPPLLQRTATGSDAGVRSER
jgi:hypothetical protein